VLGIEEGLVGGVGCWVVVGVPFFLSYFFFGTGEVK